MAKYKLVNGLGTSTLSCIKDTETGDVIPIDSSNTEYQNYQSWVSDGNTADPAD